MDLIKNIKEMCYSTRSSLVAWIVAVSIAVYLLKRNQNYDRWIAIFILTFTIIQLLEAGIWVTNPQNGVNTQNRTMTSLLFIALMCQPLVQSYLGYRSTGAPILLSLTYLYLFLVIYQIVRVAKAKGNIYSTVGPNGHLQWNINGEELMGNSVIGILYIMGLLIPLFFMKNGKGIPLITIGVLTLLWSLKQSGNREFGSLWCYTAVAYSLVALYI